MSSAWQPNWNGANSYESLADDEQVDYRWGNYGNYCTTSGHDWADTGMKWTYCKKCNIEGEWNMKDGYTLCTRKK